VITMTGIKWERCELKNRRRFDAAPINLCALDWCAKREMEGGKLPGDCMLTPLIVYCLQCERLVWVEEMMVKDVHGEEREMIMREIESVAAND